MANQLGFERGASALDIGGKRIRKGCEKGGVSFWSWRGRIGK